MSERAKNEGFGALMLAYFALGVHYVHSNLWLGSIEVAMAGIGLILAIRANYYIGRDAMWDEVVTYARRTIRKAVEASQETEVQHD